MLRLVWDRGVPPFGGRATPRHVLHRPLRGKRYSPLVPTVRSAHSRRSVRTATSARDDSFSHVVAAPDPRMTPSPRPSAPSSQTAPPLSFERGCCALVRRRDALPSGDRYAAALGSSERGPQALQPPTQRRAPPAPCYRGRRLLAGSSNPRGRRLRRLVAGTDLHPCGDITDARATGLRRAPKGPAKVQGYDLSPRGAPPEGALRRRRPVGMPLAKVPHTAGGIRKHPRSR